MSEFKSCSQANQDKFVYAVTNGKTDGVFFDIGCGHPIDINNSHALEQIGWTGLMIDIGLDVALAQSCRKSKLVRADASKVDWNALWPACIIDYLSLDCNGGTMPALMHLPLNRYKFKIITIEHDKYRFGPAIQDKQRQILKAAGYELVCGDVKCQGNPFEDWWVMPSLVSMPVVNQFRKDGVEFSEIVK